MKHCIFNDNPNQESYKLAVLVKDSYFNQTKIKENYLTNINLNDVIAFSLPYGNSKPKSKNVKSFINELLDTLLTLGISTIYCTDALYYKSLVNSNSAEKDIGYIKQCSVKGYEYIKVIYGINYGALVYNPSLLSKLELSKETLENTLNNKISKFNLKTVYTVKQIETIESISTFLDSLHQYPQLACDIETYGLHLDSNSLATIAFAWDKHNAVSFTVNHVRESSEAKVLMSKLKLFFERYKGKLVFHNASFDVKHIIYNCFMSHSLDYKGMLHGLHTMCRNIHDTKIISYLSLNSTAEIDLTLKSLSHEYMGNYAEDVSDINKLEINTLLSYNAKDTLATMYVFDTYYPIMCKDNQLGIYENIMLPSLKVIVQMELVGMPINMTKVSQVKGELSLIQEAHKTSLKKFNTVKKALHRVIDIEVNKRNSKLKTKKVSANDIKLDFNFGSAKHLTELLYSSMGLPVIDKTKTGQPAVGTDTLEKLLNHTENQEYKDILKHLIGLNKVSKILSTFIPAFEKAKKKDNWHYLHGSFNLGGTLSGRLSSSKPNLQNLPSGSHYGKLIKKCFSTTKEWVFCGADFQALEDKVNTLLTRDINKEKVWCDGYDGHCFRAYYYFRDQMPDIEDTVESINSIKDKYPELRQDSKAPSFALQYGGQYFTLMNNCGFSEEKAKQIEANYHKMYHISDKWVAGKIQECRDKGYIDSAFGLRIRTPILAQGYTNNLASAEARSVGNAISGQSYGLLTNRAINAFMERVWASEYCYDIMPVSLIHDAIYLMVKNKPDVVAWVNKHLIECMQWQDLEELKHDKIKLDADLDLFYPDWSNPITLPHNIQSSELKSFVKSKLNK